MPSARTSVGKRMKLGSRRWIGQWVFAWMGLLVVSHAWSQAANVTPENEYKKRIRVSEDIQPLGENPFGEQIGHALARHRRLFGPLHSGWALPETIVPSVLSAKGQTSSRLTVRTALCQCGGNAGVAQW